MNVRTNSSREQVTKIGFRDCSVKLVTIHEGPYDQLKGKINTNYTVWPNLYNLKPYPGKLIQEQQVIWGAQSTHFSYMHHSYFYLVSTLFTLHNCSTAQTQRQSAFTLVNVSSFVWWPCSLKISVAKRKKDLLHRQTRTCIYFSWAKTMNHTICWYY